MNKNLLVLLLVCLVSVHAFVKRDAPEAAKEDNFLEKISKEASEGFAKAAEELKKFVPDTKKLQEFTENLQKQVQDAVSKMGNQEKKA